MSSTDQDVNSTILLVVPDPPTNTPYIPSEVEAKHYFYGLPSKRSLQTRRLEEANGP